MKRVLIIATAVVLVAATCIIGCGKKTEVPLILVINSYHPEYDWVQELNPGFDTGFKNAGWVEGTDYRFEIHYMDTKRNPGKDFAVKAGEEAVAKIDELKPAVVILVADNALEYCGLKLLDREDNLPVVFCAVNQDPVTVYGVADSFDHPGHNITGTLHVGYFKNSVEILRAMVPGASKCAVLYDDSTIPTPHVERLIAEAPGLGVEIVTNKQISSYDDWKTAVLEANGNADFIYLSVYHTLKDASGNTVDGADVLKWTIENATIPTVAIWEFTVTGGALCGETITAAEHAKEATNIAVKIINGVPVGSIPINTNVMGSRIINTTTAAKLGITIPDDLRASCEIIR